MKSTSSFCSTFIGKPEDLSHICQALIICLLTFYYTATDLSHRDRKENTADENYEMHYD